MVRWLSLAGSLVLASTPVGSSAQSVSDSVIATTNGLFRAMLTHDTVALNRLLLPDARLTAVVPDGDSTIVRTSPGAAWAERLGASSDTLLERIWSPVVHVSDGVAALWAAYDFHRGGKFSHCGADAFTMVRTRSGWRITDITYTVQRIGCRPSPLGPPR